MPTGDTPALQQSTKAMCLYEDVKIPVRIFCDRGVLSGGPLKKGSDSDPASSVLKMEQ